MSRQKEIKLISGKAYTVVTKARPYSHRYIFHFIFSDTMIIRKKLNIAAVMLKAGKRTDKEHKGDSGYEYAALDAMEIRDCYIYGRAVDLYEITILRTMTNIPDKVFLATYEAYLPEALNMLMADYIDPVLTNIDFVGKVNR